MSTTPAAHSTRVYFLALAGAFTSGALLAVQSRLNGVVSEHSGRPLMAALWSFGSGLLVLTIAVLAVPQVRRGVQRVVGALRRRQLKWWQCIGGFFGGLLVAVQAWSVPVVGVAIFSVAVVGGQTLSGLLVDRLGLGPAGVQSVTGVRLLAATVAVVGVVIASTAGGAGNFSLLPAVAAFLVGTGMAVQQAINGRVSAASRSPMATTWQNFFVGSVTLLVASAFVVATSGTSGWSICADVPPWALTGGLVGIIFIAVTAWAVRITGVLVFGLLAVAGQLLTAVALDLTDPVARGQIGTQVLIGLFVTLVAAIGAALARNR